MKGFQATQEEMLRKAKEYQEVVSAGKKALKEKEEEIMKLKNRVKME